MAKEKIQAPPGGDASGKTTRITVEVEGEKEIVVACEPADVEKAWARPTKADFIFRENMEYTLKAPPVIGYSPFVHWKLRGGGESQIVGTSPHLMIKVPKQHARYVAVYQAKRPVDVLLLGTDRNEHNLIKASQPDINGRTEITTPGVLTYLAGTKVTFSAPAVEKEEVADVLYGSKTHSRDFLRWEPEGQTPVSSPDIEVEVNESLKLRVLYARVPVENTPNERDVQVLGLSLWAALNAQRRGPSEYVVLFNGMLLPIFGKLSFPSADRALVSLKAFCLKASTDWLARAPASWKAWLADDANKETFITHWISRNIEVVPVDEVLARRGDKKEKKDRKIEEDRT